MKVGDRCRLSHQRHGCIAYIGEIADLPKGDWIGVKLDLPIGKNSGSINGIQYFACELNCGLFVRPEKLILSNSKETVTKTTDVDTFWKYLHEKVSEIELSCTKAIDMKSIDLISQEIPHEIALLNEYVAQAASIYLAKYDTRQAQVLITNLEQKMQQTKEQIVPRKKFSFRTHDKKPSIVKEHISATINPIILPESNAMTFEKMTYQVILINEPQEDQPPDIVLSHLENCTICVLIETYAIRGVKLSNCKIYTGPVAGSILLHDCMNCEFHVVTRQLRIHDTIHTNFYLSIGSNPIIEDCDDLGFAPYLLSYPKLQEQLISANMVFDNDLWQQVNDFKWHRAQHSPHWKVLQDRVTTVVEAVKEYVTIMN